MAARHTLTDRSLWVGIILAGGRSSRYGSDKCLAVFQEKTFLSRAIETMKSAVHTVKILGPARPGFNPSLFIPDDEEFPGPAFALWKYAGQFPDLRFLVSACDQVWLKGEVLEIMKSSLDQSPAVFLATEGIIQPLPFAILGQSVKQLAVCPGDSLQVFSKNLPECGLLGPDSFREIDPSLMSWESANSPGDLQSGPPRGRKGW